MEKEPFKVKAGVQSTVKEEKSLKRKVAEINNTRLAGVR